MAFGFKFKRITTKGSYTLEEFYDKIKDVEFTAGKPMMAKHGLTTVIVFPPLDSNNQIWVQPSQLKAPYSKWQIYKNQAVGVDNLIINEAFDQLTHGWSRMSGVVGRKAKEIEKLVVEVASTIDGLGL